MTGKDYPRLRLRIVFDDHAMLGPGKADLLELIRETGSISGAGRAMGMSYKRAWTLVETMNSLFRGPLVTSSRGGSAGGGASLTPDGERVLDLYRRLEARLASDGHEDVAALKGLLKDGRDG